MDVVVSDVKEYDSIPFYDFLMPRLSAPACMHSITLTASSQLKRIIFQELPKTKKQDFRNDLRIRIGGILALFGNLSGDLDHFLVVLGGQFRYLNESIRLEFTIDQLQKKSVCRLKNILSFRCNANDIPLRTAPSCRSSGICPSLWSESPWRSYHRRLHRWRFLFLCIRLPFLLTSPLLRPHPWPSRRKL